MKFVRLKDVLFTWESGNRQYQVRRSIDGLWYSWWRCPKYRVWVLLSTEGKVTVRGAFAECHRHRKEHRVK